jgi:D-alanyl-D-alanine carboxypeptidase
MRLSAPRCSHRRLGELPTGALDETTASRLQTVLQTSVASGVPDAIAAVVSADGMWAGAAGVDGPDSRAAQVSDMFGIASVSKIALASLVLRLAELGKIDLDAPLSDYLPGMTVDANGSTIRQALAMRSGLGDSVPGTVQKALANCDKPWTSADVLASIPRPFGAAGTTYHHSNPTYKLLSYAAEHAAATPMAAALESEVFAPAGVERMLLQGPTTATPQPWALPIQGFGGDLQIGRYGTGGTLPCLGFSSGSLAAAAIASDAPSLARWGWQLFAGKVIGADSLRLMTAMDNDGHGLGIDRLAGFGQAAYGLPGSEPGYAALLVVLPERQLVVAAFVNDEHADTTALVQRLLDALPPRTTPSPSVGADQPGGWIVLQGNEGLTRVRPNGTDRHVIVPSSQLDASHADWSPDGKRIAFQAGVEGFWDIWIANADGSGARVLVDCQTPCINADAPAWSPDAQSVAFSRLDQDGDLLPSMLQVVDLTNGAVRTVATTASGEYVTDPRWSPDGRTLAVTLEDHRDPMGALVEHPVTSAVAVISAEQAGATFAVLTKPELKASYPDWNPLDGRIVFQVGDHIWWDAIAESSSNLYVMASDGSDVTQLTHFGAADPAVWLPAWMNDGKAILATRTVRETRENDIVAISPDGSALRELGIGGAHARQAASDERNR